MSNLNKTPIVLANWRSRSAPVEGDCACPVPPAALERALATGSAWQALPGLYRTALPGDHALVFHPQGQSPAVLNAPALRILDAFAEPLEFEAAALKLRGYPASAVKSAAQDLALLGLLAPPDGLSCIAAPQAGVLTVWLHVTNACNLACDYCYLNKTPDELEIALGKQAVDAVFRSALRHGFKGVKIKYAGGEATLNLQTVFILHDYAGWKAQEAGISLEGVVLSNGVGLGARSIEALQQRSLRLSISLDGVGAAHDAQRKFINGRGSFSQVERTLDRLQAHRFIPSITITLSNRNLEGLPATVRYLLERDLPFSINFYRENECSVSFDDLVYQDQNMIAAMTAAFAAIEANLPRYSLLGALTDRARLDVLHDKPCGVGESYMVIDQHGSVARCHMEIERSITDITHEDPLGVIRESSIGVRNFPVGEKEGCRECDWRYWCAGGCPALTYRVTGRFDVKSPNCRIYKALFPQVLRLEGLRLLKFAPDHTSASLVQ